MVQLIPRSKLEPHPDNPRKDLGDLTELAASIQRSGILQNLTVVPSPAYPDKYRVIIGHRRLAASEIAGLEELPCSVQNMDLATQVATMIAENMQRNDLTLADQVGGVQTMMDLGIDAKGIAERTGLSASSIRKRMKLTGINSGSLKELEKKGATLIQLAEIADLDEDLRTEMINEFGSTSYTWKLNKAKEVQRARKNVPMVREAVSKWATEVDTRPWNIYQDNCVYVANLELIHVDTDKLKRPNAPDDAEFVFYIDGSSCTIYRVDNGAQSKEQAERHRKEAIRNMIRSQEFQIAERAKNLREEFIRDYSGREKDKSAAYKFVTYILLHNGYMRPASLPLWRKLIGVDGHGLNARNLADEDRAAIDANPLKAMVQAAYQKWADAGTDDSKRCTSYTGEYERNEDLITVYNHLAALGYQIADEEWDWLLGKHQCFSVPEDLNVE